MSSKKFGIIGGDIRQYYLAQSLIKDGHKVIIYGINTNQGDVKKSNSLNEIIDFADYVIFPVPTTRDGENINAPLFEKEIPLDSKLINLLKNKIVFNFDTLSLTLFKNNVKNKHLKLFDYNTEKFKISNALPTAEGAIKIAMEESKKTIKNSKTLVVGYGRIGKILSKLLYDLNSSVTISARKKSDKTWGNINGYNVIDTPNEKSDLSHYDIIFNTVPNLIFTKSVLLKCSKNTLIIDLASMPGGIDKKEAENLEIKTIHALGLPGKYFPKTSGEIIKSTLYELIKEHDL